MTSSACTITDLGNMELFHQFHSRCRGRPTYRPTMKSRVCLVLVCWTFTITSAVNRSSEESSSSSSLELTDSDDPSWKLFSESLSSLEKDVYQTSDPFAGFQNQEDSTTTTTTTTIKPTSETSSVGEKSPEIYLRTHLDILNPQKLDLFLTENRNAISKNCRENLMTYLTGLKETRSWAMKILDASGSYSFTFLFGNDYWLGSQTACLDFLHPRNANDSPPFPVAYYSAKYHVTLNISSLKPVRPINVGFCLPSECSKDDLKSVLENLASPVATLKALRSVPDSRYNFYTEPVGITLVAITLIGLVLVIAGTLFESRMETKQQDRFDQGQRNKEIGQNKTSAIKISTVDKLRFYVNHHVEGNHKSVSDLDLTERTNSINSSTSSGSVSSFDSTENKIGIGAQVLLCFSFRRNFQKICNSKTSDSLACVHGLRVFSLLWVIAGHTCMITMPFVDNKNFRMIVERDFLFQSISNGAFSVDTFFFISGLLISYVFYKAEVEKNRGDKEESVRSHARNSLMKFIGGVTYRLIRLTPPYVVVLILTYLTGRWFYFNSVFDPPVGDHVTCPQYWWRNLLYINTLFPVDQMCMIWSWYLADDTQFYFLGLMILLISSRYVKFATTLTTFFLVSSWATTAVITLYTQHKPSIEEPLGLFDQLYDKPWTRLGPYIVGMAVGVYLARVNCKATYHKGVVAFGWIISMITTFVLVHGLYGELGQVESAAYVALSHTAWALAISWVVIACVTGYGGPVNAILSSKIFAPLSRLTYCAYLIHPLIMLSTMAHMDGPIHLQRDTMVIAIFGYFFASYLASIVLTIVFEAPAVALLNKFHPLKKKMK